MHFGIWQDAKAPGGPAPKAPDPPKKSYFEVPLAMFPTKSWKMKFGFARNSPIVTQFIWIEKPHILVQTGTKNAILGLNFCSSFSIRERGLFSGQKTTYKMESYGINIFAFFAFFAFWHIIHFCIIALHTLTQVANFPRHGGSEWFYTKKKNGSTCGKLCMIAVYFMLLHVDLVKLCPECS